MVLFNFIDMLKNPNPDTIAQTQHRDICAKKGPSSGFKAFATSIRLSPYLR